MSEVTRGDITLVPDYLWDRFHFATRALREIHKTAGGTSKMRRKKARGAAYEVYIEFSGPPGAVQFSMEKMSKVIDLVQDARASAHESLNKNLFSGRFSRQERNRAEAFDVVISELLRKKKEGK